MGKLSIDNISKNIFRTASINVDKHQKVESNQTNPFGVSFKGNVLTADVFDTSEKSKVSFKGRLASSAMVASIAKMSDAIGSRLNTVANFGRRIKANIANSWDKANNIEINLDFITNAKNLIKTKLSEPVFANEYSPSNLDRLSVEARKNMLAELLPNLATA